MKDIFFSSLKYCLKKLIQKEVIAYPTESIFGLGCDPDSKIAVQKLLFLKNRDIHKGLILLSGNYKQLIPYIKKKYFNKKFFTLHKRYFLTFLVPASSSAPYWLTGYSKFIAVRITKNKFVKNLCYFFNKPIVSTSANISGENPCLTIKEIKKTFGKNFPILYGSLGKEKKPSKIINILTGEILRE
jgi:L-threonylcarbamoyladenylate synthase